MIVNTIFYGGVTMKAFEKAEIGVVTLLVDDVIKTSNGGIDQGGDRDD